MTCPLCQSSGFISVVKSKPEEEQIKRHYRPCPMGCKPLGRGASGNTPVREVSITADMLKAVSKGSDYGQDSDDGWEKIDWFKLHGVDRNG